MGLDEIIENKESKGFFDKFCKFIGKNRWIRNATYTLSALTAIGGAELLFNKNEVFGQINNNHKFVKSFNIDYSYNPSSIKKIEYNPLDKCIYCIESYGSNLFKIDVNNDTVISLMNLTKEDRYLTDPYDLKLSLDGLYAYIWNRDHNMYLIDLINKKIKRQLPITGLDPEMDYSKNFLATFHDNNIIIYDIKKEVSKEISVIPDSISDYQGLENIVFGKDEKKIFAIVSGVDQNNSKININRLVEIDLEKSNIRDIINLPARGNQIMMDTINNNLIISYNPYSDENKSYADSISIVDISTKSIKKTLFDYSLGFDPKNKFMRIDTKNKFLYTIPYYANPDFRIYQPIQIFDLSNYNYIGELIGSDEIQKHLIKVFIDMTFDVEFKYLYLITNNFFKEDDNFFVYEILGTTPSKIDIALTTPFTNNPDTNITSFVNSDKYQVPKNKVHLINNNASQIAHFLGDDVNLPVRIYNKGTEKILKDSKILLVPSYDKINLDKYKSFVCPVITLNKDLITTSYIDTVVSLWATLDGYNYTSVSAFLYDKDKLFPFPLGQGYVIDPKDIIKDGKFNFSSTLDNNSDNNTISIPLYTQETARWDFIARAGKFLTDKLGFVGRLFNVEDILNEILKDKNQGETDYKLIADFFNATADLLGNNKFDSKEYALKFKLMGSVFSHDWLSALRSMDKESFRNLTVGMDINKLLNYAEGNDKMGATSFINPTPNDPIFAVIGNAINKKEGIEVDIKQQLTNLQKGFNSIYIEYQGKKTGIVNNELKAEIEYSGVSSLPSGVYILIGDSLPSNLKFEGKDVTFIPYSISTNKNVGTVGEYSSLKKGFGNEITINGIFQGKIDSTKKLTIDIGKDGNDDIIQNASLDIKIVTDIEGIKELTNIPKEYFLSQNYPNPFNPNTKVEYSLPKDSYVELKIFNILGQEVKTLVNQRQSQGIYSVEWDGRTDNGENVSSGLYLYRFQTGKNIETRKMILLK